MSSSRHKVVSFVAAMACSTLLLAGCGSSDENNEPEEATPNSSTSEEEAPEEEEEEDKKPADKIKEPSDKAGEQGLRSNIQSVAMTLDHMLLEDKAEERRATGILITTDGEWASITVGTEVELVPINEGNTIAGDLIQYDDDDVVYHVTGYSEGGEFTEEDPLLYDSSKNDFTD